VAQLVCRYRKGEQVRWISHLDLKRTLERALRRADIPLALTQGHNPHPKISYGPPLPLGATGEAELLTVHLAQPVNPSEFRERVNAKLPRGIELTEAWTLPTYKKKETFGEIDVAEYRVRVTGDVEAEDLQRRTRQLLDRAELTVHRGGRRPERVVNLRPHIISLSLARSERQEVELQMRLRTGSHGGARPQEIIALLGLEGDRRIVYYHRTGLYAGAEAPTPHSRGVWHRWSRTRSRKERG
jgi:radical SAM-linked protein